MVGAQSVIMLFIAGMAVGLMSDDPGRLDHRGLESVGLSEFFIGVIVVAIVGNAAEHRVAVLVAWKDKMDLAVNIAIGSAARSRCSWRPCWSCARCSSGRTRWRSSSAGSSSPASCSRYLIAAHVTNEGETTWSEGSLLAVYAVLGLTFFFAWTPGHRLPGGGRSTGLRLDSATMSTPGHVALGT